MSQTLSESPIARRVEIARRLGAPGWECQACLRPQAGPVRFAVKSLRSGRIHKGMALCSRACAKAMARMWHRQGGGSTHYRAVKLKRPHRNPRSGWAG